MGDIIRAVEATIWFGETPVDAYKLQKHEFEKRLGVTGVSEALGYSKQWFSTFTKRPSKRLEVLQREGFTGSQIEVRVPHKDGQRGSSIAKTISIRDFNKLIAYEALKKKNVKAIILLVALSEAGLERVISDAFSGVSLDWFGEKIIHYSQWTYEELEEVLADNRADVRSLYPWGQSQEVDAGIGAIVQRNFDQIVSPRKSQKLLDNALAKPFIYDEKQTLTKSKPAAQQTLSESFSEQASPSSEKTHSSSRLMDKLQTPPKEAKVRLTVDLPESMHRKMSILAARTGKNKAEIMRVLLDETLKDIES